MNIMNDAFLKLNTLKKEVYITITESAKKQKLSRSFIHYLASHGRIAGGYKSGNTWFIPKQWKYKPRRRGGKHGPKEYKPLFALKDPSNIEK